MKKIALIALTLVMLLAVVAMPLSVSADESSDVTDTPEVVAAPTTTRVMDMNKFNVSAGSATAKQGDLVEIPVTIETNPGIWGVNIDVHYDEKVMVLQNIVFSDEFKKDMACIEIDNLASDVDHNYNIPFGLYAEANSLTSNVKTTGLLATVTFLVIPGCELGTTDITLTYKPSNIIDVDGNNVLSAMYNGTVEVTKGKDAEPGVTYFPSRTRKSTTAAQSGALGGNSLIFILIGVVLVVGVVLAILVVRKPAPADEKVTKAVAAKPADDKPAPKKTEEDAPAEDDGIDDQA